MLQFSITILIDYLSFFVNFLKIVLIKGSNLIRVLVKMFILKSIRYWINITLFKIAMYLLKQIILLNGLILYLCY